jgi:murein DD-endopeptidase MepM/ murein hydrolase activator NlpD
MPALAFETCDSMLIPAARLHEVSRGFSGHHSGLDLMAPYGSPVRAAAAGTVVFAGRYFAYGNIVDIRHSDSIVTRYAHLSAFAPGVHPGTEVATGEVIGAIGTSGNAHGAHVHFEVRISGHAVDPKPWLGLSACLQPQSHERIEEARAPGSGRAIQRDPPVIDARPGGLFQ